MKNEAFRCQRLESQSGDTLRRRKGLRMEERFGGMRFRGMKTAV